MFDYEKSAEKANYWSMQYRGIAGFYKRAKLSMARDTVLTMLIGIVYYVIMQLSLNISNGSNLFGLITKLVGDNTAVLISSVYLIIAIVLTVMTVNVFEIFLKKDGPVNRARNHNYESLKSALELANIPESIKKLAYKQLLFSSDFDEDKNNNLLWIVACIILTVIFGVMNYLVLMNYAGIIIAITAIVIIGICSFLGNDLKYNQRVVNAIYPVVEYILNSAKAEQEGIKLKGKISKSDYNKGERASWISLSWTICFHLVAFGSGFCVSLRTAESFVDIIPSHYAFAIAYIIALAIFFSIECSTLIMSERLFLNAKAMKNLFKGGYTRSEFKKNDGMLLEVADIHWGFIFGSLTSLGADIVLMLVKEQHDMNDISLFNFLIPLAINAGVAGIGLAGGYVHYKHALVRDFLTFKKENVIETSLANEGKSDWAEGEVVMTESENREKNLTKKDEESVKEIEYVSVNDLINR